MVYNDQAACNLDYYSQEVLGNVSYHFHILLGNFVCIVLLFFSYKNPKLVLQFWDQSLQDKAFQLGSCIFHRTLFIYRAVNLAKIQVAGFFIS